MKQVSMYLNMDGETYIIEGTMMPFGQSNTAVKPTASKSIVKTHKGRTLREPKDQELLQTVKDVVSDYPVILQAQLATELGVSTKMLVPVLKYLGLVATLHVKNKRGESVGLRYNPKQYSQTDVLELANQFGYL